MAPQNEEDINVSRGKHAVAPQPLTKREQKRAQKAAQKAAKEAAKQAKKAAKAAEKAAKKGGGVVAPVASTATAWEPVKAEYANIPAHSDSPVAADTVAADLREAETFLRSLTDDTLTINACFAEGLWQVPGQCPDLHGIRVLRPGLRLLRRQGKTLLPDHALSHAVNAKKIVGLTDDQAAAYLHGEALDLPALENGWTQALYRHWPLGWGKQSQGTLKNHYPKGLRK